MIVCSVALQDAACALLSRAASSSTHLEERDTELAPQSLEKKEEPGEAVSERWQHLHFTLS